jgi:hypothetical protein
MDFMSYSRDKPARDVALNTGLGNGVKSSSYGVPLDPDDVAPSSTPVIMDDILLRRSSSGLGDAIVSICVRCNVKRR